MLKTIGNTRSAANPEEIEGKVGGDSVIGDIVGGGEANNPTKRKIRQKRLSPKF